MGVQEMPTGSGGIAFISLLHLAGLKKKRNVIINSVFKKFFKDVTSKSGWGKITSLISAHSTQKIIPSGSTPSKSSRTGDTQETPFNIDQSLNSLMIMWADATHNNLFINSTVKEDMKIEADNTGREKEVIAATRMWNAVCYAYESIHEIEEMVKTLAEVITTHRYGKEKIKNSCSPAQLHFFGGDFINGMLISSYNKTTDSTPVFPVEGSPYTIVATNENDLHCVFKDVIMPSGSYDGVEGYFGPDSIVSIPWNSLSLFNHEFSILKDNPLNFLYDNEDVKVNFYNEEFSGQGTVITSGGFEPLNIPIGGFAISVVLTNNPMPFITEWKRPYISSFFYNGFNPGVGWGGSSIQFSYRRFERI